MGGRLALSNRWAFTGGAAVRTTLVLQCERPIDIFILQYIGAEVNVDVRQDLLPAFRLLAHQFCACGGRR